MRRQKKTGRFIALLVFLMVMGSWSMHKFYVSLTEVRYNEKSKHLEVSIRIFPDDLDRALFERAGIQTQLATELEAPQADSLLKGYLLEHFSIKVDGKRIPLNYLGKEPEADAIWCYLESDELDEPVEYTLFNAILTQTFPDQVNIVQLYQKDWNKGLMLDRDRLSDQVRVD